MGLSLLGVALVVVLASMGCGARQAERAPGEVKRRFSFEFDCPIARVVTTPIRTSGSGYISIMGADGCGRRAVYVINTATGAWVLNSNGEQRPTAGASAETAPTPTQDTAAVQESGPEVIVRREGERVSGVRVRTRSDDAQIDFLYLPARAEDTVLVQLASMTSVPLEGCTRFELRVGDAFLAAEIQAGDLVELDLEDILRGAASPEPMRARFCGRFWTGTTQDSFAIRRLREATPPPETSSPRATPTPRAQRPDAREALVRQRLNAAAAIAHACTGSSAPIGVEAEWNVAGELTLRVRGVDDNEVNRCLQTGVGPVQMPVGGSGRVVHAIP